MIIDVCLLEIVPFTVIDYVAILRRLEVEHPSASPTELVALSLPFYPVPAAAGSVAPLGVQAVEKGQASVRLKGNSGCGGRPASPADGTAPGMPFLADGSAAPGGLGSRGEGGCEEDGGGFLGQAHVPAIPEMPDNGICLNLVGTQVDGAQEMFDEMSERGSTGFFSLDVPLEDDGMCERGPAMVERVGNSIRATYSLVSSGAGQLVAPVASTDNADSSICPGASEAAQGARDVAAEVTRRTIPPLVRADGAG